MYCFSIFTILHFIIFHLLLVYADAIILVLLLFLKPNKKNIKTLIYIYINYFKLKVLFSKHTLLLYIKNSTFEFLIIHLFNGIDCSARPY